MAATAIPWIRSAGPEGRLRLMTWPANEGGGTESCIGRRKARIQRGPALCIFVHVHWDIPQRGRRESRSVPASQEAAATHLDDPSHSHRETSDHPSRREVVLDVVRRIIIQGRSDLHGRRPRLSATCVPGTGRHAGLPLDSRRWPPP